MTGVIIYICLSRGEVTRFSLTNKNCSILGTIATACQLIGLFSILLLLPFLKALSLKQLPIYSFIKLTSLIFSYLLVKPKSTHFSLINLNIERSCSGLLRTYLIFLDWSVRVYILGPARVAIDSRSLSVFLAVWRRGAGH